jgi:hypothetical protein
MWSPSSTPLPTFTATPWPTTPPGANGAYFGLYEPPLPLASSHTSAFLALRPNDDWREALDAVQTAGGHVIVNLVGKRQDVKDADGHFSLSRWQAQLDRWRGLGLEPYIADGTILALRALDAPHDAGYWNGQAVSYTDLEALAAYAHAAFPGLRVMVSSEPIWLAQYAQPWQHLDGVIMTYSLSRGDVNPWLEANLAALADPNLSRLFYLWVLNGLEGGDPAGTAMSGDELRNLGRTLLNAPDACGLLIYRHEASYLGQPDVAAAMNDLSVAAQSRPACSLP